MLHFLTDEHRLIAETARGVFADLAAVDRQKHQKGEGRIASIKVTAALAEIGIFDADPDDGTLGSAQVQSLILREVGAASLPYPILEALACSRWMASSLTDVPLRITTPSARPAMVHDELPVLDNGCVRGRATLVPLTDATQLVLLTVRANKGAQLVEVSLDDSAVTLKPRSCVEPDHPVTDLILDGARGRILAGGSANAAIEHELRLSLFAAAEVSGACRAMVEMCRDHLLTRTQFGRVLGTNQALKHTLADMHVVTESISKAVDYAAAALDAGAEDTELAIRSVKYYASRNAKTVADSAMQLHGAIGYTMEYSLQLLMRRAYRLCASHGAAQAQGHALFELFESTMS